MTNTKITARRRVQKDFDLYSIRDAATYLGVTSRTVHYWATSGLIQHLRASNCSLLFTRKALAKFKKANAARRAAIAKLSIKGYAASART